MFVRSPSAYEALKSFNILQLPSRTTLQSYTGAFLHEAGASLDTITKQTEIYRAYVSTCKREGKSVHNQMEFSFLMKLRLLQD